MLELKNPIVQRLLCHGSNRQDASFRGVSFSARRKKAPTKKLRLSASRSTVPFRTCINNSSQAAAKHPRLTSLFPQICQISSQTAARKVQLYKIIYNARRCICHVLLCQGSCRHAEQSRKSATAGFRPLTSQATSQVYRAATWLGPPAPGEMSACFHNSDRCVLWKPCIEPYESETEAILFFTPSACHLARLLFDTARISANSRLFVFGESMYFLHSTQNIC